ncbi:MAG: hypothetical protein MUE81_18740 [Thermoflexibacter sp.]|nr:hypothetical protein [Thermoflexibacter sp.]
MRKIFFLITNVLFIIVFLNNYISHTFAQGCSDAGFCTMGAMKPNQSFNRKLDIRLQSLEISQGYGFARFGTHIWATTLDANFSFNSKTMFQVKLPYMFTSGRLGDTNGISDISLSLSRNVFNNEQYQIGITLGTKIPTNRGDLANKDTGAPLPMYYQTSLGTYDFIFGASLISRNWLFALGYQQALNANNNQFIRNLQASDDGNFAIIPEATLLYPPGNQIIRGKDIMVRVERNFRFARFNFFVGILPIYRFTKDSIVLPTTGKRVEVLGSDGLAFNVLVGFGYQFSTKSGIKFLYGKKELDGISRPKNPDGLSREWVVSVGYLFRF